MDVQVGVEVDDKGQAMVWVAELPGCYARGRSVQEALDKVPLAVFEFCVWLQTHGEELAGPGAVTLSPPETVRVASDLGQAESTALFAFDRLPPAGAAPLALRAAQYARADLLEMLPRLHPDMLNLRLEGANRSLVQTLDHLILTDVWYALRATTPDNLEMRTYLLSVLRDAILPLLAQAADAADLSVSQYRDPSYAEPDQEWTPFKALRRLVWHDRVHYRQLSRQNERLHAGGGPART